MTKAANARFEILEKFSVSKSGKDNEDLIYIDKDFCAVFDGATSKTSNMWNGKTAGKLTVDLLAEFMQSESFKAEIDGKTAVDLLQARLGEYAVKNNLEAREIHLCASGVIYSRERQQIWSVGDCQYAINGKVTAPIKRVDTLLSEVRALLIHCLMLEGKKEEDILKNDESRAMLLDILKKQRYLENAQDEYGFPVFNGKGIIREISIVDVPSGSEVVLASDGYPVLLDSLEESEEKLKEIMKTDPLCFKEYQTTKGLVLGNKSFDDRSYLKFRVD